LGEERPSRALAADVGRGAAFEVAVVPLHQRVAPLGVRMAGEARGLGGALERAREDGGGAGLRGGPPPCLSPSRRPSAVRATSVRPVWRPLRLHSVSPCRTSTISGARSGWAEA